MSSPTSRAPVDPSDWAPRATRERAAMERLSSAAQNDPLPSHAPDQAGEHLAQTPAHADVIASPKATAAAVESPSGDRSGKDGDLARLEESLRWLQRQDAAFRLPRVASLPIVPGLTPPETPRLSRGEIGSRRVKSLEPEVMPPPPVASRRWYRRASLALFTTSIAVAAVGYYLGRTGWWPPTRAPAPVQAASSSPKTLAFAAPVVAPESGAAMAREDDADALRASEASDRARGMAQLAKLSERDAAAMVPAGEPVPGPPPVGKAPRTLDPDEIKLLLKQGEQFVGAGDLASARVVLRRAAQAGDASAAVALGATYDPLVLAQAGVVGFAADIEQARSWYQKAESLGSPDATPRLQALANR